MKKTYFLAGMAAVFLAIVGCRVNIYEWGLPFVPTVTSTAIPTRAATPTPTLPPKPEKTEGIIQTTQLENGDTLMVDTELGYQVVFSPEWLVVGLDGDVDAQLAAAFGDQIPESVSAKVNSVQGVRGVRAVALDYTGYYYELGELNANIQLVFKSDAKIDDKEVPQLVEDFVAAAPTQMPNANVIYEVIETNFNGIQYGKMIITFPRETFAVPGKQMVVVLKVPGGLLTLTASAIEDEYQQLESNFQQVVDSIELVQ